MCTSCWYNCLQHGGDDGLQTEVQVLQVTHNNPGGRTGKEKQTDTNIHVTDPSIIRHLF